MTRRVAVFAFAVIVCLPLPAYPFPVDFGRGFRTRSVQVQDGSISLTIGGSGPAVVLLHGYSEDSRMWRPLALRLANRFTVIAMDLPGIGNSSVPSRAFDFVTAAKNVRSAARTLGYKKVAVVGHDIGLIVAYAYAASYPEEVSRLALMDLFIPGTAGWQELYCSPSAWHLHFYGPTALALVAGRERIYFDHFWNDFAADSSHSLSDSDREAYTDAYARPGRMAAAFTYFASISKDAPALTMLTKTKLTMPVLAMGGSESLAGPMETEARLVADDVTAVSIQNAGHWLIEERPNETIAALVSFLER